MATYKEIKGVTVQTRDEDPVLNGGSWSSGGDMNAARTAVQSGGTGNANAIVAGGYNAGTPYLTRSESYNGTSWTETAENNDARQFGGGTGTNTNAIIAGGDPSSFYTASETWNGSAWTEAPNMNTNKNQNQLTGNATAAITAGGGNPSAIANVESWNGSAWTETSYDLNTAKKYVWMNGTTTAALIGGFTPSSETTESLDGTTWTEVSETSISHRSGSSSGARDDCIVYGTDNGPGYSGKTEQWNGSSWTEVSDLSTGRAYLGGTGSTPDSQTATAFGGSAPSQTTATEEWAFPPVTQDKLKEGMIFLSGGTTLKGFGKAAGIPTASWSSGADMNTARAQPGMGAGNTNTDALAMGGYDNPPVQYKANIENYNGSTWTELNDLNTGRQFGGGGGTKNSAIVFGGTTGSASALTETFDGTSATEVADLNTAKYVQGSASQVNTAALSFGGYTTTYVATTESWNGTSWTEVNDLNNARGYNAGAGTSTNAISISGEPSPRNYVENWDGTSWTEIAEINTARAQGGCSNFGPNDSVIYFGGEPGSQTTTEFWNGSSWTELNDLGTARTTPGGAGTTVGALAFGGNPTKSSTEEWNADNTLSTVTVS